MTGPYLLNRLCLLCLSGITGLYLAALFATSPATGPSIQLVGMLELTDPSANHTIQLCYTVFLAMATFGGMAALGSWPGAALSRLVSIIGSSLALAMTVSALGYAVVANWRPTFYEYYIGEALTVLCLTGLLTLNPACKAHANIREAT